MQFDEAEGYCCSANNLYPQAMGNGKGKAWVVEVTGMGEPE